MCAESEKRQKGIKLKLVQIAQKSKYYRLGGFNCPDQSKSSLKFVDISIKAF
jgi:hypothetical protein